jgi:hypothetical protein
LRPVQALIFLILEDKKSKFSYNSFIFFCSKVDNVFENSTTFRKISATLKESVIDDGLQDEGDAGNMNLRSVETLSCLIRYDNNNDNI